MPTCPHCGFESDNPREFEFWEDNFHDREGTSIRSRKDPDSPYSFYGLINCPECDMILGGVSRHVDRRDRIE